jgi:hypothetical protein
VALEALVGSLRANMDSAIVSEAGLRTYTRQKRVILAIIFCLMVVTAPVSLFIPETRGWQLAFELPIGLAISILVFLWATYDANERGFFISKTMAVVLVLFTVIAMPIYLLRTRGRAGFKAIAKLLLFLVAIVVAVLMELLAVLIAYPSAFNDI